MVQGSVLYTIQDINHHIFSFSAKISRTNQNNIDTILYNFAGNILKYKLQAIF